MSEINTGGPAFPSYPNGQHNDGMTLRDYLAAKAMAALIVADYYSPPSETLARDAYAQADEMLKARQS